MKDKFRKLRSVALMGILCLLAPFPLTAGVSTDQLQTTVDEVLGILKDPNLRSAAKKGEGRRQLRAVIYPRFDFAEMAKRSLGSHWSDLTPKKRNEFVKLFTNLVENAYVNKIESYNGEKIVYRDEREEGKFSEVFTNVVTRKGEEFSMNYKLHLIDGEWKVYDVTIENISVINNYRSQFNRILANSSFDELLKKLQDKTPQVKGAKG